MEVPPKKELKSRCKKKRRKTIAIVFWTDVGRCVYLPLFPVAFVTTDTVIDTSNKNITTKSITPYYSVDTTYRVRVTRYVHFVFFFVFSFFFRFFSRFFSWCCWRCRLCVSLLLIKWSCWYWSWVCRCRWWCGYWLFFFERPVLQSSLRDVIFPLPIYVAHVVSHLSFPHHLQTATSAARRESLLDTERPYFLPAVNFYFFILGSQTAES